MKNPMDLIQQIKRLLILFIVALVISGITAFWLEAEIYFLIENFNFGILINSWLAKVYHALNQTNNSYPFLIYGYDWLAFGHLIIALFLLKFIKSQCKINGC